MTPAARVAAAIEVLADVEARRRPAVDALKDWGLARRFAGSGDRAAIAGLVYDALRRKSSSAWLMGEASPRAVAIGALKQLRDLDEAGDLGAVQRRGPRAGAADRSRARAAALRRPLRRARSLSAATIPNGSPPPSPRAAATTRSTEGRALASRAPVDLRVNTLKGGRDRALAALAHLDAQPTPLSPVGLRVRRARRRPRPGAVGRARLRQRPGRGAGRGLAARCAAQRRQAGDAGRSISAPAAAARRWRWRR